VLSGFGQQKENLWKVQYNKGGQKGGQNAHNNSLHVQTALTLGAAAFA
jgi:hypothetical protein